MIALVTDSTGCLPEDLVRQHGIRVVRLHLLIDGAPRLEGVDVGEREVADTLRAHGRVSTSKPSAGEFLDAYEQLAAEGATAILSVHISAELSGTVSSAELAAGQAPVPVRVLDSRSLGMALGHAVVSAAEVLAAGADIEEAAGVARRRAEASATTFYVDTLDYLRRGGRIGRASALVGSALAVKPLLAVQDGAVGPLEKVRTASKAIARLEERTVAQIEAQADNPWGVDVAVQHLDAGPRAADLRDRLQDRIGDVCDVRLVGLGAVVAAHAGPGTIGTVVSPGVGPQPPVIGATDLD